MNEILNRPSEEELILLTEKITCYTFAIAKMVDHPSASLKNQPTPEATTSDVVA